MSMGSNNISRLTFLILATVIAACLSGCATSSTPKDPFEKANRAMFKFNDKFDDVALKPAAMAYKTVLPNFVQTGVGNFFGNLADVWTAANNFMQGNGEKGFSDVMRVGLNSTLGIGGLLDIGSEAGLVKHKEDFGQTLGVWGVKAGPYVVLPVLGSYTLRDALVVPVDIKTDPWAYKYPVNGRNVGTAVRMVDRRAALMDASNLIEEAALDRYEFVRDAYMQRRESQVSDGDAQGKEDDKNLTPDKAKDAPADKVSEPAPEPQPIKPVSSNSAPEELNEYYPKVPLALTSNSQDKHEKPE